jgi:hypothetical protein
LSKETDEWSSETELDFPNKGHQRSTTPVRLATTLVAGYRNRINNPYLDHRRRTRPIFPDWRRRPIVIYASYNARRRPTIIYASYNRRRHPGIHSGGRGNGAGYCVPRRERTASKSDPETGSRSQRERTDQGVYLDIPRQRYMNTDREIKIPVRRGRRCGSGNSRRRENFDFESEQSSDCDPNQRRPVSGNYPSLSRRQENPD